MHTPEFRLPFGRGWLGVLAASVIAVILINAYFDGQRSTVRGAFALGAILLLSAQLKAWRGGQRRAG